jgi:hypothetical protein
VLLSRAAQHCKRAAPPERAPVDRDDRSVATPDASGAPDPEGTDRRAPPD